MDSIGNFRRILLIWKLRIHPHPIPRRSGKLNHLRRRVPPQQILLQLYRVRLPRKRPDLHTPPSAWVAVQICIRPHRCGKCLHLHLRHPRAINPRSLRRSQREVDNPSPDKRSSIRNLHHDGLVVRQIRHPHHRPHRQRQVCCGHCILVIHGAIGALASGIRRPVPARQSNFSRNRLPKTLRHRRRGGNCRRSSRVCIPWPRTPATMIRSRTCRRWRWRLIRPGRLPMTACNHQRESRQRGHRGKPSAHHGFGGGGGEAAVLRAWSSIRCASLCSSVAAARRASDPFFRTSGTTSSLTYFTTFSKICLQMRHSVSQLLFPRSLRPLARHNHTSPPSIR